MISIEIQPLSNGAHRNQSGCSTCPDGWAIIPDGAETPNFPFGTFDVETIGGVPTMKNWVAGTFPSSVLSELEDIKTRRVIESKEALAKYLEEHPLLYIDGNYYSVTAEKQSLLTNKLITYSIAIQLGQTPESLTWNTTGSICTEWTFENLASLSFAIQSYVKSFVAYQQSTEVAICNCSTVEEVEEIIIDYSNI